MTSTKKYHPSVTINIAKRNTDIPILLEETMNHLKLSRADVFALLLRKFYNENIKEALLP